MKETFLLREYEARKRLREEHMPSAFMNSLLLGAN